MAMLSVSDDEIYFEVGEQAVRDPRYCNNLGLEFFSSLQEISVRINNFWSESTSVQVEAF
jgi:hypothetical protein